MAQFLESFQAYFDLLLGVCTALYLLALGWFATGLKPCRRGDGANPQVSIIVAARNEADHIGACLDDLAVQTYPAEACEVIVVDDGSTDSTARIVRRRAGSGNGVRLLSAGGGIGGSKKDALSLGVAAARGEIILTTDADCRLPPTWVQGMVDCFSEGVGMVAGFSQIGTPGDVVNARTGWEGMDFLCLMGCAAGSVGRGRPMGASSQNLAYRKAAFHEVGGYEKVRHRTSGDDVLLLQLIRRTKRWEMVFATAPETFVVHPASGSWRDLLSQRLRWASNAPYQIYLDPLFFSYLASAFIMNSLLALSPVMVLGGGLGVVWAGGCWGAKVCAEIILVYRSMQIFGRRDLLGCFPLWTLTQPYYVVVVGILGSLGRFSWKEKKYKWGSTG